MHRGLVVYHSDTGNTEKMAKAIGEGIKDAGLDVEVKSVDDTSQDDLVAADAIVMGSPTYFSAMSGKMKAFIDESINLWPGGPGPLKDKIGAAFTSSGLLTLPSKKSRAFLTTSSLSPGTSCNRGSSPKISPSFKRLMRLI